MIRERTQTSGSSYPVGTIVAGIVCAVGLSCCFITKDDLNSWRQNDSGGRYWYDSGGYSGGGGGDDYRVGDGTGILGIYIQEAGCSIVWDLDGYYAGTGTDYIWDVILTVDSRFTDCSGASDVTGTMFAGAGAVYWDFGYLGAAYYNSTTLAWATQGYVTGAFGYTYAYDGYITW